MNREDAILLLVHAATTHFLLARDILGDALQDENTALREALTDLHAVQNGPPLIRHQAEWETAMTKTRAALGLKQPEGE